MANVRPRTRLILRLKIEPDGLLGPGKVRLLESIERLGSISAAAREMGMSYRQAWMLVETMNESFRQPVVAKATGGRKGGGAALTPTGKQIVSSYHRMQEKAEKLVADDVRVIERLLTRKAR